MCMCVKFVLWLLQVWGGCHIVHITSHFPTFCVTTSSFRGRSRRHSIHLGISSPSRLVTWHPLLSEPRNNCLWIGVLLSRWWLRNYWFLNAWHSECHFEISGSVVMCECIVSKTATPVCERFCVQCQHECKVENKTKKFFAFITHHLQEVLVLGSVDKIAVFVWHGCRFSLLLESLLWLQWPFPFLMVHARIDQLVSVDSHWSSGMF